jgi:hypothetical protein
MLRRLPREPLLRTKQSEPLLLVLLCLRSFHSRVSTLPGRGAQIFMGFNAPQAQAGRVLFETGEKETQSQRLTLLAAGREASEKAKVVERMDLMGMYILI